MKKILFVLLLLLSALTQGQVITTIAGNGSFGHYGDGGLATDAAIGREGSLVVDSVGNIWFSDYPGSGIREIIKASSLWFIETLTTAVNPIGIAFDRKGELYTAEWSHNQIRKIGLSGISIIAGTGECGFTGNDSLATNAKLCGPDGIAVDSDGNIFITEMPNNCIRKIDTSGIITLYAGNGTSGHSGDGGPATNAQLQLPLRLALDTSHNLYICEYGYIRKIDKHGIITTIAGIGYDSLSGDGGPATNAAINQPQGIAVDISGNVYIADEGNNRIRKVNTRGIITTIAGNGSNISSGDGGQAMAAGLAGPNCVTVDKNGNVYIAETGAGRIRMIRANSEFVQQITPNEPISIYPNPVLNKLTVTSKYKIFNIAVSNLLGQEVYRHVYNTDKVNLDVSDLPAGIYVVRINDTEIRKFVKE